jgi:hypothetical protein
VITCSSLETLPHIYCIPEMARFRKSKTSAYVRIKEDCEEQCGPKMLRAHNALLEESAFSVFCLWKRRIAGSESPKKTNGSSASDLRKQWRSLSKEDVQAYYNLARLLASKQDVQHMDSASDNTESDESDPELSQICRLQVSWCGSTLGGLGMLLSST